MSIFPDRNWYELRIEHRRGWVESLARPALENAVQNQNGFIKSIAEISDDALRALLLGPHGLGTTTNAYEKKTSSNVDERANLKSA